MKDILIDTAKPYHALVGAGLLGQVAERLDGLSPRPARVMVVTDSHVAPLYLEQLAASLASAYQVCTHIVPAGEGYKTPETLIGIVRAMAEAELTRSDLILALGGGVVGDMAGFASAVYQRGMRFVQLPTTLLCAVDASVGGKTAVDLPEGKNLMGAFHQPSAVICDTDTFRTLSDARWSDGASEMIKHGMIADAQLFERMRTGVWRNDIVSAVADNISIKRSFVVGDERDQGRRQLLNFGHTIGHAIEVLSGYQLSHGQAVAIGMVMETRAAHRLGLTAQTEAPLLEALASNGLPCSASAAPEEILRYALHDKKRQTAGIAVAVPDAAGMAHLETLDIATFRRYVFAGVEA